MPDRLIANSPRKQGKVRRHGSSLVASSPSNTISISCTLLSRLSREVKRRGSLPLEASRPHLNKTVDSSVEPDFGWSGSFPTASSSEKPVSSSRIMCGVSRVKGKGIDISEAFTTTIIGNECDRGWGRCGRCGKTGKAGKACIFVGHYH